MDTYYNSRRSFIKKAAIGTAVVMSFPEIISAAIAKGKMKFGLVTYQWGRDWDLPTLIANCEKAGLLGVELRTEHAHKVEINLTAAQRAEVKKRFADSPVECIG